MWQNKGLIFTKEDLLGIDNTLEFVKSPQFLMLPKGPTFFFSAQRRDATGKWVARPYSATFSRGLDRVLSISQSPVLSDGALGAFDEHGIFPFSPLEHHGKYLAFTTGWSRRNSVDIEMSIGLAVSEDGEAFKRIADGPVMAAASGEPFLVGDAFVKYYNEKFYMWYIFGDEWLRDDFGLPQRRYRIAQAESADGLSWVRPGQYIISSLNSLECQALPSVVYFKDRYHMMFCRRDVFDFREGGEGSYRLGYAWSSDLTTWNRDDNVAKAISNREGWDESMQCYPNLFVYNNHLHCAYNGNSFGLDGFGLAVFEG